MVLCRDGGSRSSSLTIITRGSGPSSPGCRQWRTEGGGRGAGGPRAQALEGAPAQRVGANFKRWGEFQPSKSSIYAMGPALPMH